MNQNKCNIKRALISVSDKAGVVELAQGLAAKGVEIISTGGTARLLRENNIDVIDVSAITGCPEIMGGRVKTLHPAIHGGILGLRDQHQAIAEQQAIKWIDLVVCNLYPFANTIAQGQATFDQAIDNIDIGGPAMLRAAAKNMGWVTVVVDSNDYSQVLADCNHVDFTIRKKLAIKAFQHTAHYDALVAGYLKEDNQYSHELTLGFTKKMDLRYGENPHQAAAVYVDASCQQATMLNARQLQGKQLSYNNIADGDAAIRCLASFDRPACVIVKHANPCGVAVAATINHAFDRAFQADSTSAFGGIVALNEPVNAELASILVKIFFEIIIAPGFDEQATRILSAKTNLRLLCLTDKPITQPQINYRSVQGGLLAQEQDVSCLDQQGLTVVTEARPADMEQLLFAWHVVKQVKSNAIVISAANATLGIGAGQVSRIDAVELALKKSDTCQLAGAVLASDAFFPFRDSIDCIAGHGIKAVIQPGGSKRDAEVIAACNEHGIAMVFTGVRVFQH